MVQRYKIFGEFQKNPFLFCIVLAYSYLCRAKTIDIMEQGLFYEICGWVASIGMILGYLPQAIETIRTRNTDGIALPTFLMMAVGGMAFMLQGLLHEPEVLWSLFLTNLVTTSCSVIVFTIKIYNDYFKKK
jgi:MtN3 and saliva related transmembrane protein